MYLRHQWDPVLTKLLALPGGTDMAELKERICGAGIIPERWPVNGHLVSIEWVKEHTTPEQIYDSALIQTAVEKCGKIGKASFNRGTVHISLRSCL